MARTPWEVPPNKHFVETELGSWMLELEQAFKDERAMLDEMHRFKAEATDKSAAEKYIVRELVPKLKAIGRRIDSILDRL